MPGVAYLDSSAFLKLVIVEHESQALLQRLREWPVRTASVLVRTEVVRALRRSGNDAQVASARRLFRDVHLIRVDEALCDHAGDLAPATLRSLDAIHVAAALSLGSDVDVAITYDDRQRSAFEGAGIEVIAPH